MILFSISVPAQKKCSHISLHLDHIFAQNRSKKYFLILFLTVQSNKSVERAGK